MVGFIGDTSKDNLTNTLSTNGYGITNINDTNDENLIEYANGIGLDGVLVEKRIEINELSQLSIDSSEMERKNDALSFNSSDNGLLETNFEGMSITSLKNYAQAAQSQLKKQARVIRERDDEIEKLRGEIGLRDGLLGTLKNKENELRGELEKIKTLNNKNHHAMVVSVKRMDTAEKKLKEKKELIKKLKARLRSANEQAAAPIAQPILDLNMEGGEANNNVPPQAFNIPNFEEPPMISPAMSQPGSVAPRAFIIPDYVSPTNSMATQASQQDSMMDEIERELANLDENEDRNENENAAPKSRFRFWNK